MLFSPHKRRLSGLKLVIVSVIIWTTDHHRFCIWLNVTLKMVNCLWMPESWGQRNDWRMVSYIHMDWKKHWWPILVYIDKSLKPCTCFKRALLRTVFITWHFHYAAFQWWMCPLPSQIQTHTHTHTVDFG